MTRKNENFIVSKDIAWEAVAPGVQRQILAYNDDMMVVRVSFEAGAVGAMHSHPHVQSCMVEKGVFDVTIGDKTQRLVAGDGYLVEGGLMHGAVAIEPGALLDVFTPMREDFV